MIDDADLPPDEVEPMEPDVPAADAAEASEPPEAERPEGPCKMVDGVYVALSEDELADFLEREANPPPPVTPDGPTLSDWRVALRLMGRFDEVDAAVAAAHASGSLQGAIAYERFNFANHVYRAELMKLAPVMGFSEADVDESLRKAAEVAAEAVGA